MDNGYATLRCVLKVHRGCDACMRHAMEIAGSIIGLYTFTLDPERNTARISGLVDPNFCMKAIARCNGHAQVLWANLSHPKMTMQSSYGYGYGYDSSSSNYYPTTSSYQYPCSNYLPPPPPYNYYPPPPPPPPPAMDYYYGGDNYSLCSIM